MGKGPLHVLWIPSWYAAPGHPYRGMFFRVQSQALRDRGFQVGIVSPQVASLREFSVSSLRDQHFSSTFAVEEGTPTYSCCGWNLFPKFEKGQMWLWTKMAERLVGKYIAKYGKPDLIHAHSVVWGGIAAQKISQKISVPYMITEHLSRFMNRTVVAESNMRYVCDAFENAVHVVAVSSALKRAMSCYMEDLSRVHVIPNHIDTNFFRPTGAPKPGRPFRFLTCSFLQSRKNIPLLLEAFRVLLQGGADMCLEIGGEGPERKKLEKYCRELGIGHRVKFLGGLAPEGVREALERAHAFVLPSKMETFGVVLIEALAMGVPVIATRCGGPEDIVSKEVGRLVDVDDREELIEAMRDALIHYDQHNSKRIREVALNKFSQDVVVDRVIDLYSSSR